MEGQDPEVQQGQVVLGEIQELKDLLADKDLWDLVEIGEDLEGQGNLDYLEVLDLLDFKGQEDQEVSII